MDADCFLSRIKRLEMLDEVEELDLVLEHYAITWVYQYRDLALIYKHIGAIGV